MKCSLFSSIVIFCGLITVFGVIGDPVIYAQGGEGRFDREACLDQCKRDYGGVGASNPDRIAYGAAASGYTRCVTKCERSYWKEFDKKTDDQQ